jgi:hypothetical protein
LELGAALVKPFVFGAAPPNGLEDDVFDPAPKVVVGSLLKGLVDSALALGPASAPNTLVEGWLKEFVAGLADDEPNIPEAAVEACEGAPNGLGAAIPFWLPDGFPKMFVREGFDCDGAPKALLELCVENVLEVSCFGAKGLNAPLAGEENWDVFLFVLPPKGFVGAGDGALLKGSTFCSAGGSVNRTCLLL